MAWGGKTWGKNVQCARIAFETAYNKPGDGKAIWPRFCQKRTAEWECVYAWTSIGEMCMPDMLCDIMGLGIHVTMVWTGWDTGHIVRVLFMSL